MSPSVLDLCCGMGGLSLGFALAGFRVRGLDIDHRAALTYNLNLERYGCGAEVRDILCWEPRGEWDAVVGGTPCQPFSRANTSKRGESHPLYPVTPRFFGLVSELRPKAFLWENVRGLLDRAFRGHFERFLATVRPYYKLTYAVLNAADYGVPQRRERLIVLGVRRDLGVEPSLPPPTHSREPKATLDGRRLERWVTVREAIGDLLENPPLEGKKLVQTNPRHGKPLDLGGPSRTVKVDGRGGDFCFDTMLVPLTEEQVERIVEGRLRHGAKPKLQSLDEPSYTINTRQDTACNEAIILLTEGQAERIRREREDVSRHFAKMPFPDPVDEPSRTISSHTLEGTKRETIVLPLEPSLSAWFRKHPPAEPDEPNPTVPAHMGKDVRRANVALMFPSASTTVTPRRVLPDGHHETTGVLFRRLTVREALRLQSFPDWWRFPDGLALTHRYRLVGEAVPPILAYRLACHVMRLLGLEPRPPSPDDWALPYYHRCLGGVVEGWRRESRPS